MSVIMDMMDDETAKASPLAFNVEAPTPTQKKWGHIVKLIDQRASPNEWNSYDCESVREARSLRRALRTLSVRTWRFSRSDARLYFRLASEEADER